MSAPMSPLAKSGLTWLSVMLALAAFFVIRYQVVQGTFTSINPVSPGVCRAIAQGVQGPEDFEIDPAHDAIFVSSNNRGASKPNSDAHDGLYLLKLSDPAAKPVKLSGTPADFHPHGISLVRDASGESLAVIDHKATGRQAVEVYSLTYKDGAPVLAQQSAVQGGLLVSPNDVSLVGPNQFYITNDHATHGALGRFAEDYLLWPHADLLLFNGTDMRIAVQRMALPNGVAVRGSFAYVTAMNERRIISFTREDFTGNLDQTGSLSIPARLDNISVDAAGDLIVAGQAKPGSAQVFRVKLDKNGVPASYETIFSDDGHALKGASSAEIANGHLFIGSARDSKMLMCDIK